MSYHPSNLESLHLLSLVSLSQPFLEPASLFSLFKKGRDDINWSCFHQLTFSLLEEVPILGKPQSRLDPHFLLRQQHLNNNIINNNNRSFITHHFNIFVIYVVNSERATVSIFQIIIIIFYTMRDKKDNTVNFTKKP